MRRDGARVRCFTRNGNDLSDRLPAIVEAAARLRGTSFLIDGEVVIARYDGTPDFHALRSGRRPLDRRWLRGMRIGVRPSAYGTSCDPFPFNLALRSRVMR